MSNNMAGKIFINKENKATFICPECNVSRTADVSMYLDLKTEIKIKCKCKCGHFFKIILERRKYFRKQLKLSGVFIYGKEKLKDVMTVTDLSRSGIKFKVNSSHEIKLGNRLLLEFRLDDKLRSLIRKEVVVRNIDKNIIGAEFCSIEHYDKLGPYLMFK